MHIFIAERQDKEDVSGEEFSRFAKSTLSLYSHIAREINEKNGMYTFMGLYDKGSERRIKSKIIIGRYGLCWQIHEDELDEGYPRFLPLATGNATERTKQFRFNLEERPEMAKAEIFITFGEYRTNIPRIKIIRKDSEWGEEFIYNDSAKETT